MSNGYFCNVESEGANGLIVEVKSFETVLKVGVE
jgi:hypothetical protein